MFNSRVWNLRRFSKFNYILIIQILPILVISSYLIGEINEYLFEKQVIYYGIGLFVFTVIVIIPWRIIAWWFIPFSYLFSLILVESVQFFGVVSDGAKRWLAIPGTHFTMQPSELFKITVILMLGYLIMKNPPEKEGYGLKMFLKLSAIILVPFIIVLVQPDLGTALSILLPSFGVLFVVGIRWKIWAVITIIVALSAPLMYNYGLKPYQKQRIEDFINKPSYQVQQALIAIGSGGLKGKEKEEATQTQMKFLPVASTDFIFAYLGERLGFIGMASVVLLYILLILHLLYISKTAAQDCMLRVVSAGIAWILFIHMGVNIYMIIGLAPVVGLPLPMFSHGGTSFLIFVVLFGILQNLLAFQSYLGYNSDSKISMITKNRV
ncbi:MAG: rod shape-determining protein RodA [Campylobacterales bacterium]|nr:rod shape-determining protein RodA [Campylobacterales bacterium]